MFKLGQKVFDQELGWGKVYNTMGLYPYPVVVQFGEGFPSRSYTEDGRPAVSCRRTLFFAEPTITEECLNPPPEPYAPRINDIVRVLGLNKVIPMHSLVHITGILGHGDVKVSYLKYEYIVHVGRLAYVGRSGSAQVQDISSKFSDLAGIVEGLKSQTKVISFDLVKRSEVLDAITEKAGSND